MCIYIGIEDLVANALIELVEKSKKREVLFRQLDAYGTKVIGYLNANHKPAALSLSRESTDEFLYEYSEYFELFSKGMDEGIRLRKNVLVDQLWKKFRGYLTVEVMLAFMNEDSVSALGVHLDEK